MFYISFIFYYWQQVLCTLRVSSLLSPLSDASVDIVDDEGSFQFSPEGHVTKKLCRMNNVIEQSQSKNSKLIISTSTL